MNTRSVRAIVAVVVLLGATAVCAGKTSARWRTYRSADYGFAISYPASMTMYPDRPVKATELSMIPVCDWTVACFQYNGDAFHNTDVQSAGVSVNVLREKKSELECDQIDTGPEPVKKTTINGTPFVYGNTGEAALGTSNNVTEYRAFYRNVCFEVSLVVVGTDISEQEMKDLGWNDVDPRAMRRIQSDMEKMLRSFAFIGPVADGANWDVYSGCGGEFEYPSEVSVEKVVEYSVRAQQSGAVTCEQAFKYNGREYSLTVGPDLRGENALDEWLSASGYPRLEHVKMVARGDPFTEYSDGTYTYIYSSQVVYIFTVSDENHRALPSKGDRVFAHFVRSFRHS